MQFRVPSDESALQYAARLQLPRVWFSGNIIVNPPCRRFDKEGMTAFTAIAPARRELPEPDTEWARGRRLRAVRPQSATRQTARASPALG